MTDSDRLYLDADYEYQNHKSQALVNGAIRKLIKLFFIQPETVFFPAQLCSSSGMDVASIFSAVMELKQLGVIDEVLVEADAPLPQGGGSRARSGFRLALGGRQKIFECRRLLRTQAGTSDWRQHEASFWFGRTVEQAGKEMRSLEGGLPRQYVVKQFR